mmetsp:Transcript_38821/g.115437  ORF Transcript_38821/g.115437 Transcript_38821/m.115437 type:complete len:227 (+) Transcript_38821:1381-2061(+)
MPHHATLLAMRSSGCVLRMLADRTGINSRSVCFVALKNLCDANVSQLRICVLVQQDISRLDISVNHWWHAAMQIRQGRCDLIADAHNVAPLQALDLEDSWDGMDGGCICAGRRSHKCCCALMHKRAAGHCMRASGLEGSALWQLRCRLVCNAQVHRLLPLAMSSLARRIVISMHLSVLALDDDIQVASRHELIGQRLDLLCPAAANQLDDARVVITTHHLDLLLKA